MTVLVTGGSGFVGSAVVRRLVEAGAAVRVLVRINSNRRNLQGLPVEQIEGDLVDPASLARALRGCEGVFHVAADYRLWAAIPLQIYRNNVDGTRNVMRAAGEAGVRRIVYTSSVATLGRTANGSPADETTPAALQDMIGHYKRSKYLAEEAVHRMVREQGLPAVIVNPSTPVGPRDVRPTPTGRMIRDAVCGRMPAYVDTGLNIVHVDDVGAGHLLAFERGTPGKRYVLGGTDLTLREILVAIAALTGTRAPRMRLPHRLVLPAALLAETWARLTGGDEPRITVDGVRMSMRRMYFSSARAQRELGYRARPPEEALADAVRWFQSYRYCH